MVDSQIYRQLKRYIQPRYPSVAYIPDRFLVVVLSAVFAWRFDWDSKGLDILGNVQSSTGSPFPFRWPFVPSHMHHVREAMSTSFLIALLGFFESSVAAKSLGGGGSKGEAIQGMSLSANRELVALGVANIVGGCFMALPAFGGYGRSKVNASTGGKTPMSSIILSLITVICVLFLLPYFYYIPVGPSRNFNIPSKLTQSPEIRSFSHDLRSRLFPHRRSPPRHPLLHPYPWLLRTNPNGPHLRLHNLLLTHSRYRPRRRPLPPLRHPPLNKTPYSDPWKSPRNTRPIRKRRRQSTGSRIRRRLPHSQNTRTPHLRQHRRLKKQTTSLRTLWHHIRPSRPPPRPRSRTQQKHHLRRPRRNIHRRLRNASPHGNRRHLH